MVSIQKPEYTGENRCVPCTVVNIVIATIVGAIIARTTSWILGTASIVASLGIIYVRGYLVPGTPQLTKRYFPDWILRWFDKGSASLSTNDPMSINPEQVLLNAHVVVPCQDGTDFCLTSEFRRNWHETTQNVRDRDPDVDELRDILGATSEQLSFKEYGDALVANGKDHRIGQWNSIAAIVADIAAADVLAQRYRNWSTTNPAERARVLMSLRIFIEQCPLCDGPVHAEQEVVESCCRSYDVIMSACQNCEEQLFEIEWDGPVMSENLEKQPSQQPPVEA